MTTYKDAGVDQDRAGQILSAFAAYQKGRPRDSNVLTGIGPFASCYSLGEQLKSMREPLLASSCDGVGTKSMLALQWGDLSHLGQDLVAMNVNDLLCVGARPVLFLDYYACGSLDGTQLTALLKSIQAGCEIAGCSLVGGETAEMPGLYRDREFDLAGFALGLVDKSRLLGGHRVVAGSKLIALEASGFHSNGYSLIRRLIESTGIGPDDRALGSALSWRETLLAPTPIYVPNLTPVLPKLLAAAHITGGGLFGNLARVIPRGLKAQVQSRLWPIPELHLWAGRTAKLSTPELLATFNCGVGMILIVADGDEKSVISSVTLSGCRAWSVGCVIAGDPAADPAVDWI